MVSIQQFLTEGIRNLGKVSEEFAKDPTKFAELYAETGASMLNAAGVPLDEIREQLGHTNLNTTLGYIYNPLTEKETYQLMSKAL